MQTITINERTKVGEIVGYPDGYYIIKDNPIVLKASGADGETTEIAPDTIIKIEHADSPFHPLVTITNCDDDVTYYINSVLQTGSEYISYNTADKPSEGGGEGGGGGECIKNAVVSVTSDSVTPLELRSYLIDATTIDPSLSGYAITNALISIEAGQSKNILVPSNGLCYYLTNVSIEVIDGEATVKEVIMEGDTFDVLIINGNCTVKVIREK